MRIWWMKGITRVYFKTKNTLHYSFNIVQRSGQILSVISMKHKHCLFWTTVYLILHVQIKLFLAEWAVFDNLTIVLSDLLSMRQMYIYTVHLKFLVCTNSEEGIAIFCTINNYFLSFTQLTIIQAHWTTNG